VVDGRLPPFLLEVNVVLLSEHLERRDQLEWSFYEAQCRAVVIRDHIESCVGGDIIRTPSLIGRIRPTDLDAFNEFRVALQVVLARVDELARLNHLIQESGLR